MTHNQAIDGNVHCPVCGYYCLGKGGVGCIDKPKLCGLDFLAASSDNCICGFGIGDPRVSRHSPRCDEFRSQKATIDHLTAELSDLRMSHSRLLAACKSLTGSLWPQNETTEKLREIIGELEGE